MRPFGSVGLYGLMCVLFLLSSCVKHETVGSAYQPITSFSGRLLVLDPKHRFQVELDWQANEEKGKLRLTHALSGIVVHVRWKGKRMFWHDNQQMLQWTSLSENELSDMGVILPPWTLAKIFLGQYPNTMLSNDQKKWKGEWSGHKLQIKWSNAYRRLELLDFKLGRRAVVILNEQ